ncbi:hypothetical protein LPTSP4_17110 [Leptospira ryugenii]|uniref:Uncharacterized protein n=1 Tax=Leptospira ryugenii TaxID=1917863 RepID=A0A2P2DZZ0_9LEPT|nr:hypothetical protein [Leptospira ryugenii]GBF50187.1 hypothetical protein LPTSP4_17110 [Leptospira ryugenii]
MKEVQKTETWNRILVRFLLAFAFWEVVAIPLRMLFFSKFYFDPNFKAVFVPMHEVYWIGPIAGDLIQCFFLALLFVFSKQQLPEGLVGGILFGFLFAITAYVGPVLLLTNLTNLTANYVWWVWVAFQTLFSITVSSIYSIGWQED